MPEALDRSRLSSMPGLYEAQSMPFPERWVQAHFLRENGEWFAVGYDPEQELFYGYIDVRPGAPHWGYFSLDEIVDCWIPSLCPDVEMDLAWAPRKVKDIPAILGGE